MRGLASALLALLAGTLQAQFKAGTRVVEITLVASHGDKSVTDLRAEDLRLFDNGKEQKIASFEKVSQAPSARASTGWTIILIDSLNTAFSDQHYGREGLSKMLRVLPPGQQIAIAALGDTLHMLHETDDDYESLREAVDAYEGEQPLGWTPEIHQKAAAVLDPATAFYESRHILDTLKALAQLAQYAKRYPGPRKLIWVSSAFPTQFRTGSEPSSFHTEIADAMKKLAAANIALYPVSPQGLKVPNLDTLKETSEQTGGREFALSNDVSALIRGAMDEPKDSYLLTFVPTEYHEDGSLHELRLKTTRKGVDLRYRPGYTDEAAPRP
jgi:VWFA-related protein